MSDTATKDTVTLRIEVSKQLLMDLLCTAVEGGSNYWAEFGRCQRTPDLDYLSADVFELDTHRADQPKLHRIVTADELAHGLENLARATFASAARHLADALSENGDAVTADVVLQMTVFGDVVYG